MDFAGENPELAPDWHQITPSPSRSLALCAVAFRLLWSIWPSRARGHFTSTPTTPWSPDVTHAWRSRMLVPRCN